MLRKRDEGDRLVDECPVEKPDPVFSSRCSRDCGAGRSLDNWPDRIPRREGAIDTVELLPPRFPGPPVKVPSLQVFGHFIQHPISVGRCNRTGSADREMDRAPREAAVRVVPGECRVPPLAAVVRRALGRSTNG